MSRRAVVCGASISGLLAARALADTFDSVTVVERDALPEGVGQRPGAPQGNHLHQLLSSGSVFWRSSSLDWQPNCSARALRPSTPAICRRRIWKSAGTPCCGTARWPTPMR